MNYEAQPLQRHELEAMRTDDAIINRVLDSYRLMLDFYGMELQSAETGLLARVEPERKCAERYRNLVRKSQGYTEKGVDMLTTIRLLAQQPPHLTHPKEPVRVRPGTA